MDYEKYIGLDVHQATISVAVMDSSGELVMESILETKAATIVQFFAGLRGTLAVTFEEGTRADWLYDLLKPHVAKLLVCNPRKNALLKDGNKSDRIDARKLAELLRGNQLKPVYHGETGPDYSNLAIYNHSDLLRGGNYPERIARLKQMADVIVIDEAHHFRNPGIKGEEGEQRKSHYWQMFDLCDGKDVYLLTATPVNNRLLDLQHMIELFSHRDPGYFNAAPLGIHSLPGHFRKMEKELERQVFDREEDAGEFGTNQVEAAQVLSNDALFRAVVVQRSRAYVKKSQEQQSGTTSAIFPVREAPKVVEFNLKKTYGRLLEMIEQAFNKEKPLFSLSIYYPLAYYKGPDTTIDPLQQGRQKEVVSLIRIQFLKLRELCAGVRNVV